MKNALIQRLGKASPWWPALLLVVLCWLQFGNTLGHDYAFDDAIVITENEAVQRGFEGIPQLFVQQKSQRLSDYYGYRPITLATFALDIEIFGQNPFGGHLMNVFYFSLLSLVMFFTLRAMFPASGNVFAFSVTVLFVVHPLHVEAVANIKSRDEILVLLFGLLSVRWTCDMVIKGQWWRGIGAIAMLGFALLCKENAITFLAVLPMVVFAQQRIALKRRLFYGLPLVLASIVVVLGINAVKRDTLVQAEVEAAQTGIFREPQIMGNSMFQPHDAKDRYATGTYILGRYLKNFFLPFPLVYYYGYNYLPLTNWGNLWVWLSLLIHLGLLYLALRFWAKFNWISFGILFYFITVSPYTHFLRPLDDAMADRFLFTPSLGMIMALVGAIAIFLRVPTDFFRSTDEPEVDARKNSPRLSTLFLPTIAVLSLAGFLRTYQRNEVWKDNLTLFSNDIRYLEEDCARCNFHYADALSLRYGNQPHSPGIDQQIIRHFKKAISIAPQAYNSYISLANTYYRLGEPDQGIAVMRSCIAQFPDQARPYFHLGKGLMQKNLPAEALPQLIKARDLAPDREEHYFLLGWAWYQTGNQLKGIETIKYAQGRWPGTFEYYNVLAEMYWGIEDFSSSMQALSTLIEKAPDYRDAYLRIIDRFNQLGDSTQARNYENRARQRGLLP